MSWSTDVGNESSGKSGRVFTHQVIGTIVLGSIFTIMLKIGFGWGGALPVLACYGLAYVIVRGFYSGQKHRP